MSMERPFLINFIAAVMLIFALVAITMMCYTKEIALDLYLSYELDVEEEDAMRISATISDMWSDGGEDDGITDEMLAEEPPVVEEPIVDSLSVADETAEDDTTAVAVEEPVVADEPTIEETAEEVIAEIDTTVDTAEGIVEDSIDALAGTDQPISDYQAEMNAYKDGYTEFYNGIKIIFYIFFAVLAIFYLYFAFALFTLNPLGRRIFLYFSYVFIGLYSIMLLLNFGTVLGGSYGFIFFLYMAIYTIFTIHIAGVGSYFKELK